VSAPVQVWDLWYPLAGSQGVSFARGMTAPTEVMLVHAAPPVLRVEVRQGDRLVARGDDLRGDADMPIIRLRIAGDRVERTTIWPVSSDCGTPVLLPGGEVGVLRSWWNDEAQQEWRWTVEFYNHR
jgi:hypothetical protein